MLSVVINELSIDRQCQSPHEAAETLASLMAGLESFEKMHSLGTAELWRHEELFIREVCNGVQLFNSICSLEPTLRVRLLRFLSLRVKSFGGWLVTNAPGHQCKQNGNDISGTGVAMACARQSELLALENSSIGNTRTLTVQFSIANGHALADQLIGQHRTVIECQALVPVFFDHPKHRIPWEGATKMDLSIDEAQEALLRSVDGSWGTQRYSFCRGTYYVFQHNGNANEYHGYPIGVAEIPAAAKDKLTALLGRQRG